jgi:hypothetical protein
MNYMGKASRAKQTKRYKDSSRPYAKTQNGIIQLPEIPPEILAIIGTKTQFTETETAAIQRWVFNLPDEQMEAILESVMSSARATAMENEIQRTIEESGDNYKSSHVNPSTAPGSHQFFDRYSNDKLELCKHVRRNNGDMAFWLGWLPNKIRCAECAMESFDAIHGTQKDRQCDECKGIFPSIIIKWGLIPSINIKGIIVPVQMVFGLCVKCNELIVEKPRR